MLVDQVLEGGFLNCVMVITPSRAYINRTITWLFQWCRRPIAYLSMRGYRRDELLAVTPSNSRLAPPWGLLLPVSRSAAVAFVVLVTAR